VAFGPCAGAGVRCPRLTLGLLVLLLTGGTRWRADTQVIRGVAVFREVWRGPRPAACRSPDESFRERVVNGCGVGAMPF